MYLLASAAMGGLYLLLLFGACFGGVAGIKLYNRRMREEYERTLREQWESERQDQNAPPPPEKEDGQPAPRPQKIYYIVEKKRSRPQTDYAEPREIHFQK